MPCHIPLSDAVHDGAPVGINPDGLEPEVEAVAVVHALHALLLEHEELADQAEGR